MPSVKYIRFVTAKVDRNSGRRQGLFRASSALIDSNVLASDEVAELRALRDWFGDNLKAPDRFARSLRSRAAPKAISWFKSSATAHVGRMYAICRILNDHGVWTEAITSGRPGYIVFEDAYQIAAVPFAETRT